MNWEFLLGLLLPAYGAGYIWLIKTAREDPPLFSEIDSQLRVLIPIGSIALLVATGVVWASIDTDLAFARGISSLAVVLLMLLSLAYQSLAFFRRIAKLPPKATGSTTPPTEQSRTQEP